MLILMRGLLGAGKSTVAQRIARITNGSLVRTDIIRCELYPNPTYTKEEMDHVYDVFFGEVEEALEDGGNVIADTTSRLKKNVDRAKKLAEKYGIDFKIVKVICDSDEKIKGRIEERNDGISKTNYQEYLKHRSAFEEIDDKEIVIDNTGNLESTYQQIDQYFKT